jgi:A/G-specific adenine glycosylase
MAEQRPVHDQVVRLLDWYDGHGRDLPWRMKGGRRADPYHVWLSEIMLQQTTVAAVKDYFLKFIGLWPDVAALAAANRDDVLTAWAGLGYYARARNLHACAKAVVADHGGTFPADHALLLKLPGIGPYTAGAIAAIAFDLPYAAVDGNVERVLSRFHAIEEPLPLSKPRITALATGLVPMLRAGDFAQAMMDLGATLCTPKSPACDICPWTEDCAGRRAGIAATLPRKLARKAVPTRRGVVFWIARGDGAVLLRRRADKGLLGGMMEVPSSDWGDAFPDGADGAPIVAQWRKRPGLVRHTFTHFHLELEVWQAEAVATGEIGDGDYRWVLPDDVSGEALPTVMRKVVAHVWGEG